MPKIAIWFRNQRFGKGSENPRGRATRRLAEPYYPMGETKKGATTECRATSDHLFYMCQNLFKNKHNAI